MGEEALEGGGVGEAKPGTGRGRVWVGLDPACLPLSSCQSPPRPGWRTGGRSLARENSVSQCLSEGGVGEATAPPPPAEACGGGGAQALLVRWLEAHT